MEHRGPDLTPDELAQLARDWIAHLKVSEPLPGGCIQWHSWTNSDRYGTFTSMGRSYLAHRVAYFMEHGEWPYPLTRHLCDNKACVRPEHLVAGTVSQNQKDRWQVEHNLYPTKVRPQTEGDKARELRFRRKAQRYGLRLQKSQTRDTHHPEYGTYRLIFEKTEQVYMRGPSGRYGLTLDQIAEALGQY